MGTLIITAIVAMLLLAFGIIFFVVVYQRRVIAHHLELKKINEQRELELLQASIQSEENERMRIASELHDDVGATLASARLFLYKEKDTLFDDEIINQSKELLDESIAKIRNISHKLQPATLLHLGLELALQSLVETIDKSGKIAARHIAGIPLPRLADNVELAAYRVSQELLTNIIKHSAATTITLNTTATTAALHIVYTHNGKGMTQAMYEELIYKKGATGLKNIVNRIKSINANIKFYETDNSGYITELIIPK